MNGINYGICSLSAIPVRKEKSHESELVTELLFNEMYEVIETSGEWIRIKICDDGYEGWIRSLQYKELDSNEHEIIKSSPAFIINEPVCRYKDMTLSFGSVIYDKTEGSALLPDIFDSEIMTINAKKLLEIPYRWGGKTIFGIDCSGFTQLCAKAAGYPLPRDASQQIRFGDIVNSVQEAQAGDIAFFENKEHKIIHVGILLSNNEIIHASGKVRIDIFDKTGIFNKETGQYTHFLSAIKRLS